MSEQEDHDRGRAILDLYNEAGQIVEVTGTVRQVIYDLMDLLNECRDPKPADGGIDPNGKQLYHFDPDGAQAVRSYFFDATIQWKADNGMADRNLVIAGLLCDLHLYADGIGVDFDEAVKLGAEWYPDQAMRRDARAKAWAKFKAENPQFFPGDPGRNGG